MSSHELFMSKRLRNFLSQTSWELCCASNLREVFQQSTKIEAIVHV